MKNNDDIPSTDTNKIKQLIDRVKQGKLDQGDTQLIVSFRRTVTAMGNGAPKAHPDP